MYTLNERGKQQLSMYKFNKLQTILGINASTISEMIKKDRPCLKLPAYCITKFLDSEKEIEYFFDRKED